MSNKAWVTLATNDSYCLGALVLAHSLRRVNSLYPAVVLITPSVTDAMRDRLSAVFAEVITVDILDSRDSAHLALLQRPELGITFTKIHCWNLTQYEKCVFLDADALVVQNSDELFEREELSAAPDVGWPDCFNSGVFVFTPSTETYDKLIKFAQECGSFDGGDQGLLNSFFSDWAHADINKHLPFLYNVTSAAFYSYLPALKHYGQGLKIIHFIGTAKPWLQRFDWGSGSVDAPDHLRGLLQIWWDLFIAQVHPQLEDSMAEGQGAEVEIEEESPPEQPPPDVSYYAPNVDPESEFPWHHPESKVEDYASGPELDISQFHDPWEVYRGNIPAYYNQGSDHLEGETQRDIWEATSHDSSQFFNTQEYYHQNIWHQEQTHHFEHHNHPSEHTHHHQSHYEYQPEQHNQDHHKVSNESYHYEHQQPLSDHPHHHFDQRHEHVHDHHHDNRQSQNIYSHNHNHTDHSHFSHSQSHYQENKKCHVDNRYNVNIEHPHRRTQNSLVHVYRIHLDHIHRNRPSRMNGVHNPSDSERISNGLDSILECEGHEDITPRHPYDGFYLRHRATIDCRGRKICSHEIPPTPSPTPPEPLSPIESRSATPDYETASTCDDDDEQTGVAGGMARATGAGGELARRQGWEAGHIDYLGADSFDNIWAKISQTLQGAPAKEPSPPKGPSPPREQLQPAPAPVEVPKEAAAAAPQPAVSAAVAPAPAPVAEAPVPIASAPVAAAPAPVPVASAPSPVAPAAVAAAPALVAAAPAPAAAAPAPVASAPAPVPAPVEVASAPVAAAPLAAPAPAPVPAAPAAAEAPIAAAPAPAPAKPVAPAAPVAAPQAKVEAAAASAPASPKDEPKTEAPVTPKATLPATPTTPPVAAAPASPAAAAPASPAPVAPVTPQKAGADASLTDSPPLANTPSKESPPPVPAAKSTEEAAQETRL